jgi:ubiquinol-cytochrome c reductase cytochrome b subunit
MPLRTTSKNKIKGLQRIGPHDQIIYSIIFGSLLGDGHAEKRNGGLGTRISFYQESTHLSYLL